MGNLKIHKICCLNSNCCCHFILFLLKKKFLLSCCWQFLYAVWLNCLCCNFYCSFNSCSPHWKVLSFAFRYVVFASLHWSFERYSLTLTNNGFHLNVRDFYPDDVFSAINNFSNHNAWLLERSDLNVSDVFTCQLHAAIVKDFIVLAFVSVRKGSSINCTLTINRFWSN